VPNDFGGGARIRTRRSSSKSFAGTGETMSGTVSHETPRGRAVKEKQLAALVTGTRRKKNKWNQGSKIQKKNKNNQEDLTS